MSKFVIKGGQKLTGEISVNGAKNAALKIIAASLLSDQEITIKNVPDIEEINRLLELCESVGSKIKRNDGVIVMRTEKVASTELNPELVKKNSGGCSFNWADPYSRRRSASASPGRLRDRRTAD